MRLPVHVKYVNGIRTGMCGIERPVVDGVGKEHAVWGAAASSHCRCFHFAEDFKLIPLQR
jgi:hypothetical protein